MNRSTDPHHSEEPPQTPGYLKYPERLRRLRRGIVVIAGAALAVPSGAQSPGVYPQSSSTRGDDVAERATVSRAGRPSFLPPAEPQEPPREAARTYYRGQDRSGDRVQDRAQDRTGNGGRYDRYDRGDDAAAPEGMMITQVEIPMPPATAEPLYGEEEPRRSRVASSEPGRIRVSRAGDEPERTPLRMPVQNREPAYSGDRYREDRYRERDLVNVRNDENPLTIVPGTSTPDDGNIPPAIIYGKGQQALQEAPKENTPPPPDFEAMIRHKQYGDVESTAMANRDSGLANALGWARYRDRQNNQAYEWFERAIQWNDRNNEAAYGMALTLFRLGRYQQAEEVARWRAAQYPKLKKILADITVRRATSSFQSKNYRQTKETLITIQRQRSLTREEQNMLAWCEFHLGDTESAKKSFVQLYRARRDRYSADGVYAAYATSRDWSGLEAVVVEYRGPLESLYQEYVSQKYRDYGLQRQAYREAPTKYPELANISSSVVGGQVIARTRSGTEGTSQLTEFGARVNGILYTDDVNRLDVSIGVFNLDSGALVGDTRLGHVRPEWDDRGPRFLPKTQYDGLIDARIRWEHQCFLSPTFELGVTPINGEIDPTFVGRIGLRKVEDWGNWGADIYRDSVRDSLLSYTGMRDPYTGQKWGRVTESGVRASLYSGFAEDWGFYGAAGAGVLMGQNVQNNSHAQVSLSVSKSLKLKGFEYFGVGPALSLGFYDKNLSQFTYGHGGYFSPSYLVQGTLAARFMTKEGGTSLLRGNAGLGIQVNRQAAAPLFPDDPDGRWYSSLNSSGVTVGLDLEGLYMLSDQWAVGGQIALNVAPNYNDFSVRLSLQYFFDRRAGLFAQDFLTF